MDAAAVRTRAIVHGMVQGVGFRANTRAEAMRLGLAGFARNRSDGTVEVEAEGPETAVAELVRWLHAGPPWAEVSSVEVTELAPIGQARFTLG